MLTTENNIAFRAMVKKTKKEGKIAHIFQLYVLSNYMGPS